MLADGSGARWEQDVRWREALGLGDKRVGESAAAPFFGGSRKNLQQATLPEALHESNGVVVRHLHFVQPEPAILAGAEMMRGCDAVGCHDPCPAEDAQRAVHVRICSGLGLFLPFAQYQRFEVIRPVHARHEAD